MARARGARVAVAALGAARLAVAVVPVVVATHALRALAAAARGAAARVAVAEGRAPRVQPRARGVVPRGVEVEEGFSARGVNHGGAVGKKLEEGIGVTVSSECGV